MYQKNAHSGEDHRLNSLFGCVTYQCLKHCCPTALPFLASALHPLPSYLLFAVSLSPSVCVSPLIHLLCGAALCAFMPPVWPSQAEQVTS